MYNFVLLQQGITYLNNTVDKIKKMNKWKNAQNSYTF